MTFLASLQRLLAFVIDSHSSQPFFSSIELYQKVVSAYQTITKLAKSLYQGFRLHLSACPILKDLTQVSASTTGEPLRHGHPCPSSLELLLGPTPVK